MGQLDFDRCLTLFDLAPKGYFSQNYYLPCDPAELAHIQGCPAYSKSVYHDGDGDG